ncbi:MAG: DUF2333 family protein [Halothiobacillaceae bacterium]
MNPRALLDRLLHGAKTTARLYHPRTMRERGLLWTVGLLGATYIVVMVVLAIRWSMAPAEFDVNEAARAHMGPTQQAPVTGQVMTGTLIEVASTLLDKPGGYLSNDITPPGVLLDNMPNWEFGVLVQVRDLARALRNDFSRSQSQSVEDRDLIIAEPLFNFDNASWMLPSTEGEYSKAIRALERYNLRLGDEDATDAQFYARADNLRDWLGMVEKRLGSLSQRLSASVGQVRVNTDLSGDEAARQSTATPGQLMVRTPWYQVDDVFFEARGATWALLHFLRAAEVDFAPVLEKKNALVSLRQIIRELEASQATVWSPIILNGSGFGLIANHSLVMASYISRANAAVIDLRNLLAQG